jgi:hypothetical protein
MKKKKIVLSAIFAAIVLGSRAQATDVGDLIKFDDVLIPPIVGCTNFDDAYELKILRLKNNANSWGRGRPSDDRPIVEFYRPRTGHVCSWVRHSTRDEWRVLEKARTQYTHPSKAWFCVIPEPVVANAAPPCLWVEWLDKPAGRS